MENLSACLAGMTVFSKLDLRKGYYQVPVAASDVQKTAVITPFGLIEFKRMPLGLRNASKSFQRFMDQVLEGIPQVFVYMDDMLVASRDHVEHQWDLCRVLQFLEEHGLVFNVCLQLLDSVGAPLVAGLVPRLVLGTNVPGGLLLRACNLHVGEKIRNYVLAEMLQFY